MAADLSFPVREAVVKFLRAQASLTALVKGSQIFGQLQPPNTPLPFVRCGVPSNVPLEFSCFNGCTVTIDLLTFSENEDECAAIASELVTVLDAASVPLEDASNAVIGRMDARWTGGISGRDPEEDSVWRAVRTFDFEASL